MSVTRPSSPTLGQRARVLARGDERRIGFSLVAQSTTACLVALVAVSTLLRAAIGLTVPSVWILPDEIVYSELAKSIAEGARPSIRGVPVFGWGEVYPTLIAPAWALLRDPVWAYHGALAINALVMSFAAIPAYFLARLFVPRGLGLIVALFTVLVPSMSYTGVVMTENAFYPAFLLSVLLIARAVREPSIANQLLALVGLGVVAFTRIQGVALVGAYVAALGIHALTGPAAGRRRYVVRASPTMALALVASLVPPVVSVAQGDGLFGWLGARSGTFDEFHAREVPEWFVYLFGDLSLYLAVAPLAATVIVIALGLSRRSSEALRLFASVALPTFLAMLTSVSFVSASLDVDGVENLNERYLFYVVPLAFVGLALWIHSGLPRPRPLVWYVIGVCCLVPALVPFDRLEHNASFQSIALMPWIGLTFIGLALPLVVVAFTFACGTLWLRSRRANVGRLWFVTGLTMLLLTMLAVGGNADSASHAAQTFEGQSASWIDDALPPGATAEVVWRERLAPSGRLDAFAPWIMISEFFNPAVGHVYRLGPPTYFEKFLPTVPVALEPDRTIRLDGRPLVARFVLVTCQMPVVGQVVASAPHGALELVEVDGPVRLAGNGHCGSSS